MEALKRDHIPPRYAHAQMSWAWTPTQSSLGSPSSRRPALHVCMGSCPLLPTRGCSSLFLPFFSSIISILHHSSRHTNMLLVLSLGKVKKTRLDLPASPTSTSFFSFPLGKLLEGGVHSVAFISVLLFPYESIPISRWPHLAQNCSDLQWKFCNGDSAPSSFCSCA